MLKTELIDILERMREVYPRLVTKPAALEFWYKHCGALYTVAELNQAFDDFVRDDPGTPTIAAIRAKLDNRCGKRIHQTQLSNRPHVKEHYTPMDFAMDMLDLRIVTARMKAYLGGADLQLSNPEWLKRAKEIQEMLYAEALEKWHSGHRPEWKYWRGEKQKPWPHAEIPELD